MKQYKDVKRMSIYFPPDLLTKVEQSAMLHRRSFNQQVLWHVEHSIAISDEKSAHARASSTCAKVVPGSDPSSFEIKDSVEL